MSTICRFWTLSFSELLRSDSIIFILFMLLLMKMDQRHSAEFLFLIWSREKMSALKYGKSGFIIRIFFPRWVENWPTFTHSSLIKELCIYHIRMQTIFHVTKSKIKILQNDSDENVSVHMKSPKENLLILCDFFLNVVNPR